MKSDKLVLKSLEDVLKVCFDVPICVIQIHISTQQSQSLISCRVRQMSKIA